MTGSERCFEACWEQEQNKQVQEINHSESKFQTVVREERTIRLK